jgi:hypothetical protein
MKLTIKGLKEYVELTPMIFKQAPKILEGTIAQVQANFGMLPEDEQAEIARRRLICAECPFNSTNAVNDGYKSDRIDEHCIMCGCTISRKTASLSSACGLDCCNANSTTGCGCKKTALKNYNVANGINFELKWKAYKTEKDEQQTKNTD